MHFLVDNWFPIISLQCGSHSEGQIHVIYTFFLCDNSPGINLLAILDSNLLKSDNRCRGTRWTLERDCPFLFPWNTTYLGPPLVCRWPPDVPVFDAKRGRAAIRARGLTCHPQGCAYKGQRLFFDLRRLSRLRYLGRSRA